MVLIWVPNQVQDSTEDKASLEFLECLSFDFLSIEECMTIDSKLNPGQSIIGNADSIQI